MASKIITRESYILHKKLLLLPQAATNQITHFTTTPSPNHQTHHLYTNLFSQLRSPPTLFEAKRLHALLIVNGFFHHTCADAVLGSQVVNVYVKYGCLQKAVVVFDKLPHKSNIAWNAILRGFVDVGQFSNGIEFYHLMRRQGFVADNFTYPLVFKACCGLSDLEQGRKVRDVILLSENDSNMKRNIYVDCSMIDFFAKCGSLNEAWQIFDEMPEKDLASWSAMICGSVQNGEWFEALCLFRKMRLEGFWPDSVIVAAVLPACGRLEDKLMGMALQGCAITSGFEHDLFVSNALIDMYCKCGDTHEAHRLFCGLACKDVVTWGSLITGYAQNCQYRESYGLFLEMKDAGIRTTATIASSALTGLGKLKLLKQGKEMHGYILKQGFDSEVVLGSALVGMYCNCGSIRVAELIFQVMSNRDITIWNSMIVGYSVYGDIDSAFRMFRRIWGFDLRPNSITLMSMLPMCVEIGALRLGKEVHGYATRRHLGAVVSVGNSLLDFYCKCGYLELGVKVFNQMMEKNIVTYNSIISAHGIYGLAEQVFSFFELMKKAKIRPNKVTFVSLLSACSHAGQVDRGWLLYNSMSDDYRILPDMEHYTCMVDLLGRAGHLDDAYAFIKKKMRIEPHMNVLGSLLSACKIHRRFELAELIGKQIISKLKDSGHYVLLSNIYASSERWKDASNIRRLIKEKGLSKNPGRSWMQIGSCIHTFHARERMHPELNKIQQILESLLLDMKDEGYILDSNFFYHHLVGDCDDLIDIDFG